MTPKTALTSALAIGALALPAVAGAHGKPTDKPATSHRCVAHKVAYVASGVLAAPATLTQTKGADTPTDTSDDRYSGTLSVTVTHANRHAKGAANPITVQVGDIRLGDGVTATPAAGTRVRLIGKITKVSKRCSDQSAAGAVTIRKATLRAPKA
ncbi:MAG TPA: hypothetical protein VNT55_25300 [Baekduia sp.]|nr:hypothetical protein [Baekduia sp.]